MRVLRLLAIASFLTGTAVLVYGFVRSSDSAAPVDDGPVAVFTPIATPLPPEQQDIPTPDSARPPTPTPEPYNGAVVRLKIPRFNVDSAIEGIGITSDGRLDTPHDPLKTGWYTIYDKPGRINPENSGWFGWAGNAALPAKGNAVFSAHVDYFPDILGPFNKLKNLERDDEIIVTMDDGRDYRYVVIAKQRYDVSNIPMGDLIWPKNKPKDVEWVTLITCGGRFRATRSDGLGEYLDRDVVVAQRVE